MFLWTSDIISLILPIVNAYFRILSTEIHDFHNKKTSLWIKFRAYTKCSVYWYLGAYILTYIDKILNVAVYVKYLKFTFEGNKK